MGLELKEVHITDIKDSGERTQFESGAVRDMHDGKGRCDLLPLEIVSSLLRYMELPNEYKDSVPVLDCIYLFMQPPHRVKTDQDFIFTAIDSFCKEVGWSIPTAILEVSVHFSDGCAKYGERNWEKGIPCHSFVDSAIRHYLKWYRGDDDEPHDRAFIWNLLCLLWTLKHHPECNDLWSDDNGDG